MGEEFDTFMGVGYAVLLNLTKTDQEFDCCRIDLAGLQNRDHHAPLRPTEAPRGKFIRMYADVKRKRTLYSIPSNPLWVVLGGIRIAIPRPAICPHEAMTFQFVCGGHGT
jgi:hypothetical protein